MSRWRYLALPLVPFVAAWDALQAVQRWWGGVGSWLLDRLDPLFARFTGLWVRIGERLRPAIERIGAVVERVWSWFAPAAARVARASARVWDRFGRIAVAVNAVTEQVGAVIRRPFRPVGRLLRAAGRLAGRAWTAARSAVQGLRR